MTSARTPARDRRPPATASRRSARCFPTSGPATRPAFGVRVVLAALLPGRGQGRHRLHPRRLQPRRRCPGAEEPHPDHPVRPDRRLRPAARRLLRLRRAARRRVRRRPAAHHPQGRAADLPAPAPAQPALPSGPADRRPVPRHRARHQRHREPCCGWPCSISSRPCSKSAGHRDPVADVRLALRARHLRRGRDLHRLYLPVHQLAGEVPPHDERDGLRRADQGDRLPAELRDGQVFRQ